jgi:hypothetical protein
MIRGSGAGVKTWLAYVRQTDYGFRWGAACIQRAFSDDRRGCVTLTIETPKHTGHNSLQVYVTRTGKVRIHDSRGEWSPPNAESEVSE